MDNKCYLQVPGRERMAEAHDRLGASCCSVNNNNNNSSSSSKNSPCWRQDDNSNDKYTAAIELSNKCREFYKSRLEAANNMKSKWRDSISQCQCAASSDSDTDNDTPSSSTSSLSSSSKSSPCCSSSPSTDLNDNDRISKSRRQRNSIDQAMEKLRAEMVSLMDQDLSLMKQLLTLNETIEELKWQRQYYSCSTSCASLSTSKNLDSNWSVSDTEMYDSEDDFMAAKHASCTSVQMGHVTGPTWHSTRSARKASKDFDKIPVDSIAIRVENVDSTSAAATSQTDSSTTYSCDVVPSDKHNVPRFTSDHHVLASGPIIIRHERDQDSFDSGIHEATCRDDIIWNV